MDITERIRGFVSPHLARLAEIDTIAEADPEQGLDHLAKFISSLIRDGAASTELREILARLDAIEQTLKEIKMTEQQDVDAVTAGIQAADADIVALTAKVTAGQQAFDTAIAGLEAQIAAGGAPDLTQLKAAQAVLAGDQPNLDAAVAALAADPNLPQPAPSGDGTGTTADPGDGSVTPSA